MTPFKHSKQRHLLQFLVVLVLFIGSSLPGFAQLEKGKKLFAQEQYTDAIKPLRKEFQSKSRNIEAGILLAKCYYHLQKYVEAADVMAGINITEISSPDDILFLTDLDIANENFSEAYLTVIQQLDKNEMDEKTLTQFYKIGDILHWDTIPNGSKVSQVSGINSVYNDFSPYVSKNKELWFVSDILGIQMVFPTAHDNFNLNLSFRAKIQSENNAAMSKPTMLMRNRDYYFHDLAVVEWEKEDKLILTLKNFDSREKIGLYISDKSGKAKELVPFKYNENFNTGYATFDKSGNRMIFASDRAGGYGKMDLWYSDWENGEWTEPVNMGPVINSDQNETYPSYHDERLFFASDRTDMGYGALDLYYASDAYGYRKIHNLRSPINGPYDDFGIAFIDSKNGYFSSNRKSGVGGDDILLFSFTPIQPEIFEDQLDVIASNGKNEIIFYDLNESEYEAFYFYKALFSTGFTDKNNAFVLRYKDGKTIDTLWTDENMLHLPYLEKTVWYELEKIGDQFPEETDMKIFDSDDVLVYTGTSENKKTFSFALLDHFENQISKMENDDNSRFLYNLNPTSNDSSKTIATVSENLEPATAPYSGVAAFEDVEEIAQKTGSKFSIPNIYYDFDSYALHEESKKSIDKLIDILALNPELRIELQSHTDKRGQSAYNLWLSQQRANSVVEYMISAGIHTSRLIAVGKGESEPINRCEPGDRCTEKQHAENRRTEFMVLAPVSYAIEYPDFVEESTAPRETETTPTKFILPNIYFNFDSYAVKQESKKSLDSLVAVLQANPELRIEIQSHTDIRGSEKYNITLSKRRANAVVEYIASAGIERSRLFAVGKGDKELRNDCHTASACSEEQHAENRRTEFIILSATAQL